MDSFLKRRYGSGAPNREKPRQKLELPSVTVDRPLESHGDPESFIGDAEESIEKRAKQGLDEHFRDSLVKLLKLQEPGAEKKLEGALKKTPDADKRALDALREGLRGLRGLQQDEMLNRLTTDALEAAKAQGENDGTVSRDNVLIPLLIAQGLIEQDEVRGSIEKDTKNLKASRRLKLGVIGRVKQIAGTAAVPAAFVLQILTQLADYGAMSAAFTQGAADIGIPNGYAALAGQGLSGGANAAMLTHKMNSHSWKELFSGPRGKMFMAALAVAVPVLTGNAIRSSVESGTSREVSEQFAGSYKSLVDGLGRELANMDNVTKTIAPAIERATAAKLTEGGEGHGPRTWTFLRAIKGESEDNNNKFKNFRENPRTPAATPIEAQPEKPGTKKKKGEIAAPAAAPTTVKPLAADPSISVERSEKAIQEINAKYGLTPEQGLTHLTQMMQQKIKNLEPKQVLALLQNLLEKSDDLSHANILTNIFGGVGHIFEFPVTDATNGKMSRDEVLNELLKIVSINPGIKTVFKYETAFKDGFGDLGDKLKNIQTTIILTRYLDDISKATGVDVKIPIPDIRFNVSRELIESHAVNRSPYQTIIDKNVLSYTINAMTWQMTDQEWKYMAVSFEKAGIPIDTSNLTGKLEALGGCAGLVLFLLAGGAIGSIYSNRLKRRWAHEDPLNEDDKHLADTETKLAETMQEFVRKRRDGVIGRFASFKDGKQIADQEPDEAGLDAVLRRGIRRYIVSQMKYRGGPFEDTERAKTFIDRTSHVGSKSLRAEYAKGLNALVQGVRTKGEPALLGILREIDDGNDFDLSRFRRGVETIANYASPGYVQSNIGKLYAESTERSRQEEVKARIADIQNQYARKEELLRIRNSAPLPSIDLNDTTPGAVFSATDLVHFRELAAIDQQIAMQEAALQKISRGETSVPVPRNAEVAYTPEDADALSRTLSDQELSGQLDGQNLDTLTAQYNGMTQNLGKRLTGLAEQAQRAFGTEGENANIRFRYEYVPARMGYTVVVSLDRSSSGQPNVDIPFGEPLPNATLNSDEAIAGALESWLDPNGHNMRLMRMEAVHNTYRTQIREIREQIMAQNGGSPLVSLETVRTNPEVRRQIDSMLRLSDIAGMQTDRLSRFRGGHQLADAEMRIFDDSTKIVIGGLWNRSVVAAMESAARKENKTVVLDVSSEMVQVKKEGTDETEKTYSIRNIR